MQSLGYLGVGVFGIQIALTVAAVEKYWKVYQSKCTYPLMLFLHQLLTRRSFKRTDVKHVEQSGI